MKETLIGLLSSRRVLAVIGGFLASLLIPVFNKKLGLGLDPVEVTTVVTSLVVFVVTYIVSRTAGKFAAPVAPPPPTSGIPTDARAPLTSLDVPLVPLTASGIPVEVLAALKAIVDTKK
jgi:hypothetical protein